MNGPLDRVRLGKLLGLFSSDHDGEIVAAARRADAMIRSAGLTWFDIVVIANDRPRLDPVGFGGVDDVEFCWRRRHRLTAWEVGFVAGIRRQSKALSAKQRNTLSQIIDKLRLAAAA